MPQFNGRLNANKIFAAIYNMIISQLVFADNVDGIDTSLVDSARVDGSMYGDQKLYYATKELHTHPWGGDAEAGNLLALDRPDSPECQSIVLDVFRQVRLTIDNYLTKQAWGNEHSFSSFNSIMIGWLNDTKEIYDVLTYNTFFGTNVSVVPTQNLEVELPAATDESSKRLRAQKLSQFISNLIIKMKDLTRDYNDYGFMRSWKESAVKIIWNAEFVTELTKLDLPTIFHDSDVFTKESLKNTLPARFFGEVNALGGTISGPNTTIRALVEKSYTGNPKEILFPGDLLPEGATYGAYETYTTKDEIVCKIVVKMPPYMSGFKVGTSFFNPRSLTENHYLTFAHNTLEHLKNYPYITIKAKSLAAAAQKAGK